MYRISLAILFLFALASSLLAAGPHDIDCKDCHSVHHAKSDWIIGVKPVTNPTLPENYAGKIGAMDAACLGCHNGSGATEVNMKMSHPVGVKPRKAKVPEMLLIDGVVACGSCHNPHPSNAAYKYLQIDTKGGKAMGQFCAACHPAQSDPTMTEAAKKLLHDASITAPLVKVAVKAAAPAAAAPAAPKPGAPAAPKPAPTAP